MEQRTIEFVADACGGRLVAGRPGCLIRRVCTDSRTVRAGDLFVALAGRRFDAHSFLPEVASKGASGVLIERNQAVESLRDCAVILAANTRRALGTLAARYRSEFSLPVIAVGGSNGKTTTKELLAAVLRQKLATLWSQASFNNDIGVPLTLLRLETAHQVAILELGTNHPGELAPLMDMTGPHYGIITSIGREHLEFFGDLAGVALEEGVIAERLPAEGKLFLNGDSEWAGPIAARTRAPVVRVGFGDANDWKIRWVRTDKQGARFRVESARPEYEGEYRINLLGKHQAVNATFAIALGAELGLNRAEIVRGLSECTPSAMRMELWEHNGIRVLDDAYNANADSMMAALQTLRDLPCKGRRIAVLGDMAELGAHSEAAHYEVGRHAADMGIAQLIAVGTMASVIAQGAREGGLNRVFEFPNVEAAAIAVKQFVREGDMVLLKASRASGLEQIADMLRTGEPGRKN